MAKDLVSKKVRTEVREYFVGRTLAEIGDEFAAVDIRHDGEYVPQVSGQRRGYVEQHYATIDWSDGEHVARYIRLLENILLRLEHDGIDPSASQTLANLLRWIERDGYSYSAGRLSRADGVRVLSRISSVGHQLDLPELQQQIVRISAAVDSDPALAIGTAKELIETVCRTVLSARSVEVAADADVGQLVKAARRALSLVPEEIPSASKGSETIKKLLNNLGSLAQGVAELRNLYGTGHGKDGAARGLTSRHARLAVGASATVATFLLETHLKDSPNR